MRRTVIALIVTAIAVSSYVAIRAQGPPGGPPPPPLVLSEINWLPWNNTGLPRLPQTIPNDGPAPRRDLSGQWDSGRGGIGARGARGMPAPLHVSTASPISTATAADPLIARASGWFDHAPSQSASSHTMAVTIPTSGMYV